MNGTGGIRKNGTVEMNGNGSNMKKNPSNAGGKKPKERILLGTAFKTGWEVEQL